RDIHRTRGKNMRFLQAECLGDVVRDSLEIRVAPPASSPRIDPEAIVPREVSIERILAGHDVVIACEAETFPDLLRRIRVRDRGTVGTIRSTRRWPECIGILEHRRLQTWNKRT